MTFANCSNGKGQRVLIDPQLSMAPQCIVRGSVMLNPYIFILNTVANSKVTVPLSHSGQALYPWLFIFKLVLLINNVGDYCEYKMRMHMKIITQILAFIL